MMVRIATINARGLRSPERRSHFLGWCRNMALDIVLVQETNAQTQQDTNQWSSEWSGSSHWSTSTTQAEGLGILLSRKAAALPHSLTYSSPRLMVLEITIAELKFTIVNLYGPASGNKAPFVQGLLTRDWDPDHHHIVGGDFNLTLDPRDRPGQSSQRGPTNLLRDFFDHLAVEDLWRIRNPDSTAVTRVSPDGQSGSRIDRIYTPTALRALFKGPTHTPTAFSDHQAVLLEIADPTHAPSPYWKLNTSLLTDAAYCDLVRRIIEEVTTNNKPLSPGDLWERLKGDFRTASKAYAREKARNLARKQTLLQARLTELLSAIPLPEDALEEANKIKSDLSEMELRRLAGARIRSRARWIEAGEKPSRLFSGLEKSRKAANSIPAVYSASGTSLTTQPLIKARIREYYADLYDARPYSSSAQRGLTKRVTRKLSPQQKKACEGLLTLDELSKACKTAPRHKSPGPDGLPAEFLQTFWPELGPLLLRVANDAFARGHLPETLRTGYTTLIPKKGDLQDIANWRPISLLCSDAKIITKAIYNRLAGVISSVIGPHQTAIPGRYIHTNTRLVQDVLDYTATRSHEGGILYLDQTKAFDRVGWQLLDQTLEAMGFGPDFLKWTSALRNLGANKVIVNGELTDSFPLTRGVRQGDPLSPLLYCVALEALASAINADSKIAGLRLPGKPPINVKLVIYADDTAVFFSSAADLHRVHQWINTYEQASGAEVNKKKSTGTAFSGDPARFSPFFPTTWTSADEPVKYLGVHVGRNVDNNTQWQEALTKVTASLNLWSRRYLSLTGKRTVVNTYALSKIWYLASFTLIPKTVTKSLSRLVFNYMRGEKRCAQVAQAWFSVPRTLGGLGLVSVRTQGERLLRRWCERLLSADSNDPWNRIPWHCVDAESGILDQARATLLCSRPGKVFRTAPSPFWCNAIRLTRALPLADVQLTPEETYGLPLWDNPWVTLDGKSLSSSTWNPLIARSRVRHVYQLFDKGGRIHQPFELKKLTYPGITTRATNMLKDLVKVAEQLLPRLSKTVDWRSVPVPRAHHETAFFRRNPKPDWIHWNPPAPTSPPCKHGFDPKRWTTLLRNVHVRHAGLKWNDLFLRILHRNLPLGHSRRHYDPEHAACPVCGDPDETDQHLFWHCPAAKATRGTANRILASVNAPLLTDSTWAEVLLPTYPKGSSPSQRRKRTSTLLLHRAAVYAIWLNRCDMVFREGATDDAPSIFTSILSSHTEALGTRPDFHYLLLLH